MCKDLEAGDDGDGWKREGVRLCWFLSCLRVGIVFCYGTVSRGGEDGDDGGVLGGL